MSSTQLLPIRTQLPRVRRLARPARRAAAHADRCGHPLRSARTRPRVGRRATQPARHEHLRLAASGVGAPARRRGRHGGRDRARAQTRSRRCSRALGRRTRTGGTTGRPSPSTHGATGHRSCSCTVRWRPAPKNGKRNDRSPTTGFRLLVLDRRGLRRQPRRRRRGLPRRRGTTSQCSWTTAPISSDTRTAASGVMFAAARRPEATRSLTLLEPAAFAVAPDDVRRRSVEDAIRQIVRRRPSRRAVGRPASSRRSGAIRTASHRSSSTAALPLVPVFRRGRPYWHASCRSPSCGPRRSPNSSSPAATMSGSRPSATTWPRESERLAPWWRAPVTRSSSPGGHQRGLLVRLWRTPSPAAMSRTAEVGQRL